MRWNDGSVWNGGGLWSQATPPGGPADFISDTNISLNSHTAMEYWEVTKNRAQETLPVWQLHMPTQNIGGITPADLLALIGQFEPAATARTLAQDASDDASRTAVDGLARMKKLGIGVPKLIEIQLQGDALLMKNVDDLYRTSPRAEASILKRMRDVLPLWVKANTALAAMTPAQAPITMTVGTTVYTVALAQTLFDGHNGRMNTVQTKNVDLEKTRSDLRGLDRTVDSLNKRWYKGAKVAAETNIALADALEGITTESGTDEPETVEIDTLTQGGTGGLQVLVNYIPGGGDHATSQLVKWMVEGVDAGFIHSAPIDPSGNTLGPFAVDAVVKVMTEVSNSTGTRTTAVRTITMLPPV